MKVLVMRCSTRGAWWNKEVGNKFDVLKELKDEFVVKYKGSTAGRVNIRKSDCEVIK